MVVREDSHSFFVFTKASQVTQLDDDRSRSGFNFIEINIGRDPEHQE
jgi:hypothetical protein